MAPSLDELRDDGQDAGKTGLRTGSTQITLRVLNPQKLGAIKRKKILRKEILRLKREIPWNVSLVTL